MRMDLLKKPSLLNSEELYKIVGDLVRFFFDWTQFNRFGEGIGVWSGEIMTFGFSLTICPDW
jgi:hypothetical protein